MIIVTRLVLTLTDGMELVLDSLDAKYTVIMGDRTCYHHDTVPLAHLRDLLIAPAGCHAVQIRNIGYDGPGFEGGELVTITIFPDSVLNIVTDDFEVTVPNE